LGIVSDQEKQVSSVVLTLSRKHPQAMFLTEVARPKKASLGLIESIKQHQNHGTIDQDAGGSFTVVRILEKSRRPFVVVQGFRKPVQAMVEIPDVDIQTGGPVLKIRLLKCLTCLSGKPQRFFEFPERDKRPHQSGCGPSLFDLFAAL